MKRFLALTTIMAVAFNAAPVFAADLTDLFDFDVSQKGDLEMKCGLLSQEAVLMRDIIDITEDVQDESEMQGHGITAVGAVGSFLVGTATGGLGLAAAGFLAKSATNEKAEDADVLKETAQQRRSLMMGIYNAKGCFGPMDHAMYSPAQSEFIQLASLEPQAGKDREKSSYND